MLQRRGPQPAHVPAQQRARWLRPSQASPAAVKWLEESAVQSYARHEKSPTAEPDKREDEILSEKSCFSGGGHNLLTPPPQQRARRLSPHRCVMPCCLVHSHERSCVAAWVHVSRAEE